MFNSQCSIRSGDFAGRNIVVGYIRRQRPHQCEARDTGSIPAASIPADHVCSAFSARCYGVLRGTGPGGWWVLQRLARLSIATSNKREHKNSGKQKTRIRYLVVPAGTAGLVKRNAGFAAARGRYFCAPPLSTSATYRLPAESTLIPCTPQNPPGKFPHVPHAYMKLPFKSYLIILEEARSNAHRFRDPSI